LATLRALMEFAREWNLAESSAAFESCFARASATVAGMWRGEYYAKYHDPSGKTCSDDVFIGQLEGEWAARQLALAPVLPEENARAAARTLYRLNGDPSRYRLAPIQVRPDGRLPPRKYSWHAWPQYQMVFLDCTACYLGLREEALASVARLDRAACEWNRAPWAATIWHDARTGLPDFSFPGLDWYMNAPAVWFFLSALTGFQPHEPRKQLTFGPCFPPARSRTRYPAVTPRYWAELELIAEGAARAVRFVPRRFFRGEELEVRRIRWRGQARPARIALDGRALAFSVAPADGVYTDLVLETPAILRAGGALEIAGV
jgi:hypothetical protein